MHKTDKDNYKDIFQTLNNILKLGTEPEASRAGVASEMNSDLGAVLDNLEVLPQCVPSGRLS